MAIVQVGNIQPDLPTILRILQSHEGALGPLAGFGNSKTMPKPNRGMPLQISGAGIVLTDPVTGLSLALQGNTFDGYLQLLAQPRPTQINQGTFYFDQNSKLFLGSQDGVTLTPLGSPFLDVRAFGAKGDGVTDDSAAFQAAVNSLPPAGGVIWAPGTFLLNSTITIGNGTGSYVAGTLVGGTQHGVRILGGGSKNVTSASVQGYAKLIWGGAADATMFSIRGPIYSVSFQDLEISAASIAGTVFDLISCAQSTFRNLYLRNFKAFGINMHSGGCNNNLFENVFMGSSLINSVDLNMGDAQTPGAGASGFNVLGVSQNQFNNCIFRNDSAPSGTVGIQLQFADANTFVNCLTASHTGIKVIVPSGTSGASYPSSFHFSNCYIVFQAGGTSTSVVGTWTPIDAITFLPYPTGDGEVVPTNAGFKGETSNGTHFGGF